MTITNNIHPSTLIGNVRFYEGMKLQQTAESAPSEATTTSPPSGDAAEAPPPSSEGAPTSEPAPAAAAGEAPAADQGTSKVITSFILIPQSPTKRLVNVWNLVVA